MEERNFINEDTEFNYILWDFSLLPITNLRELFEKVIPFYDTSLVENNQVFPICIAIYHDYRGKHMKGFWLKEFSLTNTLKNFMSKKEKKKRNTQLERKKGGWGLGREKET